MQHLELYILIQCRRIVEFYTFVYNIVILILKPLLMISGMKIAIFIDSKHWFNIFIVLSMKKAIFLLSYR